MSITIKGLDMPSTDDILVFERWHGKMYARSTKDTGTKRYEVIERLASTRGTIDRILRHSPVPDDVLDDPKFPKKLQMWCYDHGIDYGSYDQIYLDPLRYL